MGCREDEQYELDDAENKLVCENLSYLLVTLNRVVLDQIKHGARNANDGYKDLTENTALLCATLRSLNEEQANSILSDESNTQARILAEWWHRHQESDRRREVWEKAEAELRDANEKAHAASEALKAEFSRIVANHPHAVPRKSLLERFINLLLFR